MALSTNTLNLQPATPKIKQHLLDIPGRGRESPANGQLRSHYGISDAIVQTDPIASLCEESHQPAASLCPPFTRLYQREVAKVY